MLNILPVEPLAEGNAKLCGNSTVLPLAIVNVALVAGFVIVTLLILPPVWIFPENPAPPDTTSAPVVGLIEFAVPEIVAVVATTRPFLTLKSLMNAISFPFHFGFDIFMFTKENGAQGPMLVVKWNVKQ